MGLPVSRHGGWPWQELTRPAPEPRCLCVFRILRPSWLAGGMEPGVWSPRVVVCAATVFLRRPPCHPGVPSPGRRGLVSRGARNIPQPCVPPLHLGLRVCHTTRQPSLQTEKKHWLKTFQTLVDLICAISKSSERSCTLSSCYMLSCFMDGQEPTNNKSEIEQKSENTIEMVEMSHTEEKMVRLKQEIKLLIINIKKSD
jgi:hypothetical protein